MSPWHLRRLFRNERFVARVESGELIADLVKNNHLTPEKAALKRQAYCTHSQTYDYLRANIRVAVVHQYLMPDGISIGGSGMPDPKFLEINGRTYACWNPQTWGEKVLCWGLGWCAGIRYKLFG